MGQNTLSCREAAVKREHSGDREIVLSDIKLRRYFFPPEVKNFYKNIHPIHGDREDFMRGISQKIFAILRAGKDLTEGLRRAHSI